jgi:hypothetical protein
MPEILITTPDRLAELYVTCCSEDRVKPFTDAFWKLLFVCHHNMPAGQSCRADIWMNEEPDDVWFHIHYLPANDERGPGRRILAGTLHYHRSDKTWGVHT